MKSIEDYRRDLAEKLGVEAERLHFEVQPGSPPSFDVMVDGKDLTQDQEQTVIAFVGDNPDVGRAKKARAPVQPPQPKARCQFCKETSVDSARVGESLQRIPYCAEHAEKANSEADRIFKRVTRPCSKCGAPAPFYPHTPDCFYMKGRHGGRP
jgi:hypothetical protein